MLKISDRLTPMISLAICCALRSRSLKSAAFRSSFVVYRFSSKLVLTPNIFSFAANWSHEVLPLVVPKVASSPVPKAVFAGRLESSADQAVNSRSRPPAFLLMSVSVLKAVN